MKVIQNGIKYHVDIIETRKHYIVRHDNPSEGFAVAQLEKYTKEYIDFFVNGECVESTHRNSFEYEADIIERLVFLFSEYGQYSG